MQVRAAIERVKVRRCEQPGCFRRAVGKAPVKHSAGMSQPSRMKFTNNHINNKSNISERSVRHAWNEGDVINAFAGVRQ